MSDRMPEDLPVTKRINVMVGITRSKVIYIYIYIYNYWDAMELTMERSTMLLMGKSTISMAMLNSKLLVYQRVSIPGWWFGT